MPYPHDLHNGHNTPLEHLSPATRLLVRFSKFQRARESCSHWRAGGGCDHPGSDGACAFSKCPLERGGDGHE